MIEFVLGLFAFAVAILLFSLIGHGIWLGIAQVCRALFDSSAKAPSESRPFTSSKESEPSLEKRRPSAVDDLASAQRLLQLARSQNWLSSEQNAQLHSCLEELKVRLTAFTTPIGLTVAEKRAAAQPATFESEIPVEAQVVEAYIIETGNDATIDKSISQKMSGIHALDREYSVTNDPGTVRAPVARRAVADVLHSFMERSNIRWVELISATLVVVCSVGLVISLWSTLSRTSRFFPSLVFLVATLAVHGAGQYTLNRWKLRTTSRGILHIGLMLIPLSVLVGILLSRREHLPELTLASGAVIAFGGLVYTALAITASRSLFSGNYWVVSVANVVSSLSLVPMHYYAARDLSATKATLLLLPAVLISAIVALKLSMQCAFRQRLTAAFARRHMGAVVQCVFAILTACVFFLMQFKASVAISPWWWSALGIIAATWVGWSGSLGVQRNVHQASPNRSGLEASWMIVCGWILGLLAGTFLLSSLWHSSFTRASLLGLLAVAAIWWLLQGMLCRLRTGVFFGGVASILALAFGAETLHVGSHLPLVTDDWVSFERIAWLTTVGLTVAVVSVGCLLRSKASTVTASQAMPSGSRLPFACQTLALSGSLCVLVGAGLTILASMVPWGPTPYGGNWAAITLAVYGALITAAGIAIETRQSADAVASEKIVDWLKAYRFVVPLGLALATLSTIRLFQSSSFFPEWIEALRPYRAWAVGLSALAVLWAGLGSLLSAFKFRSRIAEGRPGHWLSIDWLCFVAIALSILSSASIWRWSDRMELAATMGWTLPLVALGVWLAWRSQPARELFWIVLALWSCSLLFYVGDARHWWPESGIAVSVAVHALVCILIAGASVAAIRFFEYQRFPKWMSGEPFYSQPIMLTCSLIAILISAALPASVGIGQALGWTLELNELDSVVVVPPDTLGLNMMIAATLSLVAVSIPASFVWNMPWVRMLSAFAPLSVGLSLAAWVNSPLALIACAWTLAICLLASESLALFGPSWSKQSQLAWSSQFNRSQSTSLELNWLTIGRSVTLACLTCLTALAVFQAWRGLLNPKLLPDLVDPNWLNIGAMARCASNLIWLGPLLIIGATRWLLSNWVMDPKADGSSMYVTTGREAAIWGGITAVCTGLVGAFAVVEPNYWRTHAGMSLLQATGTSSAILAGITMLLARRSFVWRAEDSRSESLLELRSGARGSGGWPLSLLGLFCLTLLSIFATAYVVWYPVVSLTQLTGVASWPTVLCYASVVVVAVSIGWLRGLSRFGMLAVALGLVSPLASMFFATWLDAVPGRHSPLAFRFEPYRAQIVLWLLALAIAVCVRFAARGQRMSVVGEAAWIALACLVAILGLIATTQDPQGIWPRFEMSVLALIIVVSSVVSQQSWRGHLAAVAAAIGMVVWQWPFEWNDMGLMLWGPTWVALIALIWTIASQRLSTASRTLLPGHWVFASVDQSVSLHVPLAVCMFTGLIVLVRGVSEASISPWLYGSLAVAMTTLAVARLWDSRSGKRGLAIYFTMIAGALTAATMVNDVNGLPFMEGGLIWLAGGLTALALMAGCLREWLREESRLLPALRLGNFQGRKDVFIRARDWMTPLHACIGLLLVIPCFLLVINFPVRGLRLAAASLPLISAISILPIANQFERRVPRVIGLFLISISTILSGWSDLPRVWDFLNAPVVWQYAQHTFVTLIFLGWSFALLSEPLQSKLDWRILLHRSGWLAIGLALIVGIGLIAGEFWGIWPEASRATADVNKFSMLAAWAGIVLRFLLLALVPFGIDASAGKSIRQAAVYAVESGLALLVAAIYLCFPDLFSGIVAQWWPLILFVIAMLSALIGFLCDRLGQDIIADPVRRSSLLLPAVPLLGVWWPNVHAAGVDWSDWQQYWLLLLTAAALYGMHGWYRPSIGIRLTSAGLTLLSFWCLLHSRPDLRFFEHPQFWLLPPALATLVFVEWNRQRLTPTVVTASRYLAILVAYFSSTADMVLKAFEGEMWQPLLLLILSMSGVLVGIALRIRAFLYCGSAFVIVALLGMVWHAQQAIDQVWPWWAFGILTGVTLIVLLGYFEKNRPRVLAYVEQLKSWEK